MRTRITIALLAICLVIIPALANVRTIAKVHAGDVVEMAGGWKTRITGIRSPAPDSPVGQDALAFTRRLVEGQQVKMITLTTDNTAAGIVYDHDGMPFAEFRFGHGLALDLGAELLRRGLAYVDYNCLPEDLWHYRDIEEEARTKQVGMWAQRDYRF